MENYLLPFAAFSIGGIPKMKKLEWTPSSMAMASVFVAAPVTATVVYFNPLDVNSLNPLIKVAGWGALGYLTLDSLAALVLIGSVLGSFAAKDIFSGGYKNRGGKLGPLGNYGGEMRINTGGRVPA